MKKIVLILILLLATKAHAGDSQARDGAQMLHYQKIEKQLTHQGIPEAEARTLIQAMNQAHFTEQQMIQTANQFKTIEKQETTTRAVREKINEGIAKSIPAETIFLAASRVISRFDFAMNLAGRLDKKNQVQLGKALADCLSAGLTEENARSIAASLQTRTLNYDTDDSSQNLRMETMFTARDLSRQGVSSATTTELIGAALVQHFDAEAMRTLRTNLRNTEIENIEAKTKQFASAIAHGRKAGDLQASDNSSRQNRGTSVEAPSNHGNSGAGNGAGNGAGGGGNGGGSGSGGGN